MKERFTSEMYDYKRKMKEVNKRVPEEEEQNQEDAVVNKEQILSDVALLFGERVFLKFG